MIHTCHTAAIQTYPEILQQKTSDDVYHILHAKDRTSDVKLNKRIKKIVFIFQQFATLLLEKTTSIR
jgi:hypothetical protein